MTRDKRYQQKSFEIIKDSIKSIVYIDEIAWNPFEANYNPDLYEHKLSKDLYNNLKIAGINLYIHRYLPGDELLSPDSPLKKYLFHDIDLVLLDWDLDADPLNLCTLKLLNDIISQPNIHFCCIYSSSPHFDAILKKIKSYFSGFSKDQIDNIKAAFEDNDEIIEEVKALDFIHPDANVIGRIHQIDRTIWSVISEITKKDKQKSLIGMMIALHDELPIPADGLDYSLSILSKNGMEYSLFINNTIITILGKENNKPNKLIKNLSKHISQDKTKSFLKLLGLDMQNAFSRKGAFVSPEILNISFDTFIKHCQQLGTEDALYKAFVIELLIENARLNLGNAQLKILEEDFIQEFKPIQKNVQDNDLALINCFYNGVKFNENKNLSFGDIFIDERNDYFLCVTALCDCLFPKKIGHKFFFVSGAKVSTMKKAIDYNDSSFISYIDEKTCIKWSNEKEFVKPTQLFVKNNRIENFKLNALDFGDQETIHKELTYVFTVKQNYAQRIANQAFGYPIRVGVDFAKR
jgi:hypothetical protein